ncbi:Hemerythrin HHE cation binding domain-containing protein [Flavobacterium fluvii]|uniref:Hemerythrin HHE cation binding domain-containing protein n=1 Tax=Flavobacterium fluvii TaxID=468056 RepID=A0A1M5IF44_9FLAO|nr:hemerythrin domain-containing protein [Flavobacterium fluvii]SHG26689.1 Hemerythrin HHE cation binding domain-containing protein [Flavobacterium fluvii]
MEEKKPLKRAKDLQLLSHDHYHGLKLCWKIKTGLSKKIAPERIKTYADWFYKNHLIPHFELEEKLLFPILDPENELIKRAIAEHRSLERLFKASSDLEKNLLLIESGLNAHIRFEERELFTEIQKVASADQLSKINAAHSEEVFVENENDVFWS